MSEDAKNVIQLTECAGREVLVIPSVHFDRAISFAISGTEFKTETSLLKLLGHPSAAGILFAYDSAEDLLRDHPEWEWKPHISLRMAYVVQQDGPDPQRVTITARTISAPSVSPTGDDPPG